MKTPQKRNPLAWLATLLMLVAMWGCKTDRAEMLSSAEDSRAVTDAAVIDELAQPNWPDTEFGQLWADQAVAETVSAD